MLPSGSVVAPSFAAGVLAAVAVGRLRRRRRYRPSAPEPGRDLRRPALGDTLSHLMRDATEHGRLPDSDGDAISDVPSPTGPEPVPQTRQASPPSSFGPDPTASGLIDIGTRGEEQVSLDLGAHGVLGVAGSASEDVVRYWCTALLTHAGEGNAEVLTSASLASSLFPGLGSTNAIRAVSSPGVLLRSLEAEVMGRSRQLADADVPDAASYRTACPEDPLPYLLVVSIRSLRRQPTDGVSHARRLPAWTWLSWFSAITRCLGHRSQWTRVARSPRRPPRISTIIFEEASYSGSIPTKPPS